MFCATEVMGNPLHTQIANNEHDFLTIRIMHWWNNSAKNYPIILHHSVQQNLKKHDVHKDIVNNINGEW